MEVVIDELGGEHNNFIKLVRRAGHTGVTLSIEFPDNPNSNRYADMTRGQARALSFALRSMEAALEDTPSTGAR